MASFSAGIFSPVFTGIVTETGTVVQVAPRAASAGLTIETSLAQEFAIGDSVAINGVCLTVTRVAGPRLDFDVVTETLEKTTLGALRTGSEVNLEGALRIGDRLSGHFVQGHVDGVGEVVSRSEDPGQVTLVVRAPPAVAPFLIEKGSVTVDGVSLTTWDVSGDRFSVALVPHTLEITTLSSARSGTRVNLEADLIARWVAKLLPGSPAEGLSRETLRQAGYDIQSEE